ncbi:hypothetical protein L1987_24248 [Smallanthus sonchifolius]|uniref:Uncharacterized protein n=1 Tax=Smallanthus sonchifolius TaxID=185202 RepID=A0ACB9IJ68_9ASTR|nr:hypothetical protein L1987_24248 [Smallanthus sonchifolius]
MSNFYTESCMARAFTNEFNLLAHTEPEWKGAALQYREIIDFLNRSKISYAISADRIVSRPYLEQFWETAEHDCTVTPNVLRATVAGHDIDFSEDTIRRVLQFRDLSTDPTAYPDYFVDGCWRQRMGYVGVRDYASYKKMWVLDQWRYFVHVMIMCISSRKAGKDAMGHDLAAAMVEIASKRVDKRVFAQFLKPGSVEPTPEHTTLFGHLINEAYVAPADWRWFSQDSEPELSAHSDEQQQQVEEDESVDESSEHGDDEAGHDGAEGSNSEETESDSSDSDDTPSQAHPRRTTKVTLPESSSKRKRQSSSSEYEPDSDSDAAIKRQRRESINKNTGDRQQHDIPSEVEVSAQQQVQVQPDVAVTTDTEEVPVIVTLPVTSVQVAVTTPILTESVTITPSITPTTIITSTIPTTTEPISQPFNYGEFTQGFDFDTIFSSPIHNAKASTSRHPDPNEEMIEILETQVAGLLETVQKSKEESDVQQAQFNSLVDEVRILRSQRTGTDERLKNVMAQNELLTKSNNLILGLRSSLELRFDMQ